jgi:cytochrome c-type biogenesis protein CcmE
MNRRARVVLGAAVILLLAGVMATTITTSTNKVTPAEINRGEYVGESVTVEGIITSEVQIRSAVRFEIGGNQTLANRSVSKEALDLSALSTVPVVYDGDRLPTLQQGRPVIVSGTVTAEGIAADTIKVQAHQGTAE